MVVSTSAIVVDGFAPVTCCLVRDLSEQKLLESQLSHQALHDALTGLPNRTMLIDRLDQALARTRRHRRTCGVLYVDLDRFKTVNDSFGHAGGDLYLIEAARRIRAAVRETDTVARFGGDEFVVLCEDLEGVHSVTYVAERIIAALHVPFPLGNDVAQVSASIGIALSPDGSEDADGFLDKADIAMYRAKDNGRNCYELFDAAMQQWVTKQIALEAALQHAVVNRELNLHYQPIIAADTGAIRGFEALVRWERPGFGLVAPDSFIPTAEETGSIIEIGAWVLDEACRQAATWARRWPDRRLGVALGRPAITPHELHSKMACRVVHKVRDGIGAQDRLRPPLSVGCRVFARHELPEAEDRCGQAGRRRRERDAHESSFRMRAQGTARPVDVGTSRRSVTVNPHAA
jgi:diguanylate cyclase (GGDEF)-like protein